MTAKFYSNLPNLNHDTIINQNPFPPILSIYLLIHHILKSHFIVVKMPYYFFKKLI
jgi:hypothetical protein